MPFKANVDRRHRIPKQRQEITNLAEYDASLCLAAALPYSSRRGDQGVASRGAYWPGRSAKILGAGDRDCPDVACRVPPRAGARPRV